MQEVLQSIRATVEAMERDHNWLTKASKATLALKGMTAALTDVDNRLRALEARNG